MASCCTVLESALAPLVRSASMSAKPIVAYALSETDRHTPLMNSTDTTTAIGVCGPSSPHSTKVTAVATPFTSSTVRKPKRRSSGVVSGLTATLPANTAMSTSPAVAALQPKAPWNIRGSRNGTAVIDARNRAPPEFDTRKVSTFSAPRSSNGRRQSCK